MKVKYPKSRRVTYALVGLGVSVLTIGIAGYMTLTPPRQTPAYDGPRPALAKDGYVRHTEKITIDIPLADYEAWSKSDQASLDKLLPPDDSLPSVVRTDMVQGVWDEVGARRRVVLSDGHYLAEEVVANEPQKLFRYQVWGFTNFAKLAIDYGVGEFRTADNNGKTDLTWTYSYHSNSPLTRPLLERFMKNTWAPYMKTVIQVIKQGAERDGRP